MEILKLISPLKETIWGGTKLATDYGKQGAGNIGESWELCCNPEGNNVIANGADKGKTLREYIGTHGRGVIGVRWAGGQFPMLVKLIDAHDNLSIKVNPDDTYALAHEKAPGRTELWYVAEANQGSHIILGLKSQVKTPQFSQIIKDGVMPMYLNRIPVQKGDTFFIEPGMVHSIGAGVVMLVIQQNSNTSYRIYDYNRDDKNGEKRHLDVEKALDVADLSLKPDKRTYHPEHSKEFSETLLASCRYFTVKKQAVNVYMTQIAGKSSFHALTLLTGSGQIGTIQLKKGDSVYIPADFGEYTFEGEADIISTTM
ncbi:MAG: class I mannose-6-phosphate isomerase [Oscillospiraceae bacterium]|jgi:mannose-6-phosphate isomerase|nr:class I mannose-6-phosphate isomerase [Oscillospiraceae bacterium]